MPSRPSPRTRRLLAAWVPLLGLLGLSWTALPPGASQPGAIGSLSVSPNRFYGGQAITFEGSLGRPGRRAIWLEFNMNRPGDRWTRIDGSGASTDADGHFEFRFPARGMLNISLRVASAVGATRGVLFQATNQAVALTMEPEDATLYGRGACSAAVLEHISYDVVRDEGVTLVVDSTPNGEPVLPGRTVDLERRTGLTWSPVAQGTLDDRGEARFTIPAGATATSYRAVLGAVRDGGSRIGSYPSFPTAVVPVPRPLAATGLTAGDPDPSLPDPTRLGVAWTQPEDAARVETLVGWNTRGAAPTSIDDAQEVRTVPAGGDPRLVVDGLVPQRGYDFVLVNRSSDGVCSAPVTATGTTEPVPPVTGPAATATAHGASLTWTLPVIPVDAIRVRRVLGTDPPGGPTDGGTAFAVDPRATTVDDPGPLEASTTYTYAIYTQVQRVWSVAATVTVTTAAEPPPDPSPSPSPSPSAGPVAGPADGRTP